MKLPKYDISKLNSIPIRLVAERLGIKINRSNKALCFLHNESDPSLGFKKTTNTWKCFGCGEGGSVIDLVIKNTGLVFTEACDWLNNEFIHESRSAKRLPRRVNKKKAKRSKDNSLSKPDYELYEWIIKNTTLSDEAYYYLSNERGFKREIIEQFQLKDLKKPKDFYIALKDTFGEERLLKAGISKEIKGRFSSFIGSVWFEHVILFPFVGINDRISYIQARSLGENALPKYINLNNIPTQLYNLQILADKKQESPIFFCEGVTDTISLTQAGYPAIGVIGAHGFKNEYVELCRDCNIFVIPDNDEAGKKFYESINDRFNKVGKYVRLMRIPKDYNDYNEYMLKNG